ncbi:MAG: HAD family hydrolase [Fusobacteriota bacterium]
MENIKAFIFDFGGVIIDNPSQGIIKFCLDKLNIKKDDFSKLTIKKSLDDFQRGLILENEFWEQIYLSMDLNPKKNINIWGEALKSTFSEKKEIIEVIKKLKKKNFKIGLITNTEKPNQMIIQEQNYPFFDVEVYSCSEGIIKPNSEIYKLALKRLDIKPREAVFIDDKKENILGAKKVGINVILFDNSTNVIKKINDII